MIICFTGDNQCQFFRHQSSLVLRNLPDLRPHLDPKGLVMRLTFRTLFSHRRSRPSKDFRRRMITRVPRVNTFWKLCGRTGPCMHVQLAFKSCKLSEKIVTRNHKSSGHVGTRHTGWIFKNRVSNDCWAANEVQAGDPETRQFAGENGPSTHFQNL